MYKPTWSTCWLFQWEPIPFRLYINSFVLAIGWDCLRRTLHSDVHEEDDGCDDPKSSKDDTSNDYPCFFSHKLFLIRYQPLNFDITDKSLNLYLALRDLNRVKSSGFGLLLFSSNFASSVCYFHSDLLGALYDFSSFLSYLKDTRVLTLWAISAQKVLLFIKRTSRSLTFLTVNFLRPFGI